MKISKIREILSATVIVNIDGADPDIKVGCGCDLMSDVLAFIKPNAILLTGLTNPHSIRTAEVADIKAVCYVRDKQPPPEAIALAKAKKIIVMTTALRLYDACGKLYQAGLAGSEG